MGLASGSLRQSPRRRSDTRGRLATVRGWPERCRSLAGGGDRCDGYRRLDPKRAGAPVAADGMAEGRPDPGVVFRRRSTRSVPYASRQSAARPLALPDACRSVARQNAGERRFHRRASACQFSLPHHGRLQSGQGHARRPAPRSRLCAGFIRLPTSVSPSSFEPSRSSALT